MLWREILITKALLWTNGIYVSFTYLFYILPRLYLAQVTWTSATRVTSVTFMLFIGYIYSFEIVNQIVGATADAINKPQRPIPSGMLTHRGARLRWALSWLLYPCVSYCLSGIGGMKWALLWQAWIYFSYIQPAPNNPLLKSMFTAVGIFILMAVVDELILREHPQHGSHPLLNVCVSVWMFFVIHIQDFQDVAGDKKEGRRSLPPVLGEDWIPVIRQITLAVFCATHTAWLVFGLWLAPNSNHQIKILALAVTQWILGVALGVMVWRSRSMMNDGQNFFVGLGGLTALMMTYVAFLGSAR